MQAKSSAWYRNPWVWLIIALPMSAVIGGIITVIITNQNQPEMVLDDYYKKGKAINQELTLYNNATELGIELSIKINNERVEVKLNKELPALKLKFVHSTQSKRDFDIVVTPNATGTLSTSTEQELIGKWRVFVSPMDDSWKMKADISLPLTSWTTL